MKQFNTCLNVFLLLFPFFSIAQKVDNFPPAVTIGKAINLHSEIIKEDYTIYVQVPSGYEKDGNSAKYPVLYVLDGKYYFTIATEALGTLSSMNGNGVSPVPSMIVVALLTNNRDRDYTPKPNEDWELPYRPDLEGKPVPYGGADTYLSHLEKEVIPYVEKNYRAEEHRVLLGHSLGGLFVLHAMVKKPDLFQASIVGDPASWWNSGATGQEYINFLKSHPGYKKSQAWFRSDVPKQYWFPINILLHDYLSNQRPTNMRYAYNEFEKETHMSVIFPGIYFSLRDLYTGFPYQFHPKANIAEAIHHYDSLSKQYEYNIAIPERLYETMREQNSRGQKDNELALTACLAWTKAYPKSARAFELTARTYQDMGNKTKALEYFQASLKLKPDNEEVKGIVAGLK